ncbi:hypothetical protein MSG28_004843 [Choristoneura fumiferana]|uniref:Uncharacterized protein n=1 Tax=Choristoneura fumiferana TaxID=7141 RepID=A0ACC0K8V1_CHOFU|nr:hypothetical protein MSG28_004843 [Choristoneura fumiferana]
MLLLNCDRSVTPELCDAMTYLRERTRAGRGSHCRLRGLSASTTPTNTTDRHHPGTTRDVIGRAHTAGKWLSNKTELIEHGLFPVIVISRTH